MDPCLIDQCLSEGGSVHPLLLDPQITSGLPLCNPTILELEKDSKYLLNLRWVSYYLHHCEQKQKYQTPWGPLNYVRPDNDEYLRTENYICDLDLSSMSPTNPRKIDDRFFEKPQEWDFVGLEDIRLTQWNGSIYGSGVRRFAPDGKGRMQISKLKITKNEAIEESRVFSEAPFDKTSYCEKNWMPILDEPFKYVKWCDPTEVVLVHPDKPEGSVGDASGTFCQSETFIVKNNSRFISANNQRGGSQIISYKDYYVAVTHEVEGWHTQKGDRDAIYRHRFLVWDKSWNLVRCTPRFHFMHGKIEFCCGIASYKDHFLMTFGFQDNSAILFKMPKAFFDSYLNI